MTFQLSAPWRRGAARLLSALLGLCAVGAWAQDFPNRPIKLLVTFGPGSGPDVLAREMAPELSRLLGQSVVVENRPGAGGNVAAQALLQERKDGHALLLATDSIFTLNPHLLPKTGFDPMQDLTVVTPWSEAALFVVASATLNIDSFAGLVQRVKAQPGKVNYQAPVGSPHHVIGERLAQQLGMDWVMVSYRDPQQGLTELLNGLVPVAVSSLPFVKAQIDAGKVVPLAVATASRLPEWPKVPTIAETLPGFRESGWFALTVATGTPQSVIDRLNAAALQARETPAHRARLQQLGMTVLEGDAAALGARARQELAQRGEVVRTRGIKVP